MMTSSFRLSRLNAPRATLWSVALLVAASIMFGVWANAAEPAPGYAAEPSLAAPTTMSASQLVVSELLRSVCL